MFHVFFHSSIFHNTYISFLCFLLFFYFLFICSKQVLSLDRSSKIFLDVTQLMSWTSHLSLFTGGICVRMWLVFPFLERTSAIVHKPHQHSINFSSKINHLLHWYLLCVLELIWCKVEPSPIKFNEKNTSLLSFAWAPLNKL